MGVDVISGTIWAGCTVVTTGARPAPISWRRAYSRSAYPWPFPARAPRRVTATDPVTIKFDGALPCHDGGKLCKADFTAVPGGVFKRRGLALLASGHVRRRNKKKGASQPR